MDGEDGIFNDLTDISGTAGDLKDGEYSVDADHFSFAGGSGKVTISCQKVIVKDGKATAWIYISSAKYDKVWVKVNGKQTRYEAKSEGSGVVFQIPVDLNKQMKIMTHTMAMSSGKNIRETQIGETVNIGRMKGNIKPGDKIYKMSSKQLLLSATESYKKENRKIPLKAYVKVKKDLPIEITIKPYNKNLEVYKNMNITYRLDDTIPEIAKNRPLDKETLIKQLSKTSSTPYEFKTIDIDLDKNLFIPKLSLLNELRRKALLLVENYAVSQINRKLPDNCTKKMKKKTF